jgi:hypothetical protein
MQQIVSSSSSPSSAMNYPTGLPGTVQIQTVDEQSPLSVSSTTSGDGKEQRKGLRQKKTIRYQVGQPLQFKRSASSETLPVQSDFEPTEEDYNRWAEEDEQARQAEQELMEELMEEHWRSVDDDEQNKLVQVEAEQKLMEEYWRSVDDDEQNKLVQVEDKVLRQEHDRQEDDLSQSQLVRENENSYSVVKLVRTDTESADRDTAQDVKGKIAKLVQILKWDDEQQSREAQQEALEGK